MTRLATKLERHIEEEELEEAMKAENAGNSLERDIHFYHYVLSRELRSVQKDLNESPPKKYGWGEWEYFLRLMGNVDDGNDGDEFPGQLIPDTLAPEHLRAPWHSFEPATVHTAATGSDAGSTVPNQDGVVDRATDRKERLYWNPKAREPTKVSAACFELTCQY